MTEKQTEALQRLNQGIQESRRTVQQQTMELAQDYFVNSAAALKDQINESRATLESLPDQIPGGREEAFQAMFQELMDNYSNIEGCLDEAQQNVSALDPEQLRRQGEIDATDAARREARERGVDLTKIEGTGADGRIIVTDVLEAAEAMQAGEEESEDGAAGAAQQAQDAAGQAAGQAQQVAGQATDQAGQVAGQAQDAAGQAAGQVQDTAGQAAGQVQDTVGGLAGGGQQQGGGPLGGVTDQVGQVAGQAQDAAGQATQQVQDTAGQVTDQAGQAAGQAQQVAGQATDQAGQVAQQAQDTAGQAAQQGQQAAGGGGAEEPRATNAARRRAQELGVDLSQIRGTGAGGLITIRDVTGS
jgi:pyruvate/2-oxoglutarate dehydrogenase complex dihydrolipoamide acyltransferase (E2) component